MTTARVDPVALGARIRELRERRGWSQTEMASRVGMQQPNVASLESGRRVPTLETVVRVADVLGWAAVMRALRDATAS